MLLMLAHPRILGRTAAVMLITMIPTLCPAEEKLEVIPHVKPRLLVLTDISNEPDDEESLVRLLVYANQFDFEGLIATTSIWLKEKPREDLIRRAVTAYGEVQPNLLKHEKGFPSAESLLAMTATGQTGLGMEDVGEGKATAGSRRIIEAVDRADERPLWVTVWGGANTLAQALWDVRASRSEKETERFIQKLRVYAISDQDDAGAWLRREFPKLFYIVSPSSAGSHLEYFRSTWIGISGDRLWNIGQKDHFEMVDNPWLEEHVMKNHGALGALYPPLKYVMEGDTPSFLGLIDHGLGWEQSPGYGGWGGRYVRYQPTGETRPIWTDNAENRDTVTAENGQTETSNHATIWRWREHFQNDFAARMDWCVTEDFSKANHNPQVQVNGSSGTGIVCMNATSGGMIELSAQGTSAGDEGQQVKVRWWIYQEAGSIRGASLSQAEGLTTEVKLPTIKKPGTLHVIAEAEDDGKPHLFSYRRVILRVTP
jgi:Protein of unknown function (DUF1593)